VGIGRDWEGEEGRDALLVGARCAARRRELHSRVKQQQQA
jgi:hypothetical protein